MNEVRKSHRSAVNRVQSILEDAEFVESVHDVYNKPLVANARCGLWYVPPARLAATAYFKSTDGHTGEWAFSLKRLNLHLLPLIEEARGVVIVDSTRRGKAMPDALAKTVPIWCAVLNTALLGAETAPRAAFPAGVVAPSEQDSIRARVPGWAREFNAAVPEELRPRLSRPLRPVWVMQDAPLPLHEFAPAEPVFADAHAVVLCTASRRAQDGADCARGYAYVQGAADDHELWAPARLSPDVLHASPALRELGLSDAELARRVEAEADRLAAEHSSAAVGSLATATALVRVHPAIFIAHAAPTAELDHASSRLIIDLRPLAANNATDTLEDATGTEPSHAQHWRRRWPLRPGKRGARQLAPLLNEVCGFYEEARSRTRTTRDPLEATIVSAPGTDFAECVALLLDCRYFDAAGAPRAAPASYVAKPEVTRRNLAIIARSGLAPSRATQNIIGAFLRGS